jgi:hypothetical protein
MRNVSDKSCRENQNTHFVFSNFFSFENRAVFEIMWESVVESGRPRDSMAHAHCMLDTKLYSEYVILIAYPLQQWLQERV